MTADQQDKPLRLGIAGLGTVGTGVLKLLRDHEARLRKALGRAIAVSAVSARDRNKERGVDLSAMTWFDDPVALATAPDIDVFVELIGGEDGIAREAVTAALEMGRPVITANKALLAHHGTELARLAERKGAALKFEAAIAGGIPIVKALRESLLGNEIRRVYGILNGTCNYILTLMRSAGRDFAEALAEAQALGYAEADPSFDIGGHDAAHKLALLTSIAFGTEVAFDDVYIEGIEHITPADIEAAEELGYRIKLLGVALKTDSGIEQRVHPAMVPRSSAIAGVGGVTNCVAVEGDYVGEMMLVGPGAGAGPTASSVVSDVIDVMRGDDTPAFVTPAERLKPYERARMRAHEGGYYLRLSVYDRPGAFAAIARSMADEGVSLASIVQRPVAAPVMSPAVGESTAGADEVEGRPTPVILITHKTTEQAIRRALAAIEAEGQIDDKPSMIRIEML